MHSLSLTQHAQASRGVRLSWPTWLGMLVLLCLGVLRPAYADTCTAFVLPNAQTSPATSPMASGGTITLDLSSCYFVGPEAFSTTTAHGQASGTGIDNLVTYTNSGDGALTDSFTFPNPDNGTQNVSVAVNIAPATSPLTVTPGTLTPATVGAAYSQTFSTAGGTAPYTYTLTGTLPAGLAFSGATLSGTPTAQVSSSLSLQVRDAVGVTTTKSYTLTVQVPTISLSSLPSPALGVPYNQTITASGGTAPYTFTLDSGALPAGLSINAAGVVSGTPTAVGTSNFNIRATDSSTPSFFKSQAYTLAVVAAVTYAPASPPGGTVGVAYNQSLASASGGTAPYTYTIASGSLPSGLSLSAAGVLSGTPSAGGSFTFAVKATDSSASPLSTTSGTLTLAIAAPTIALSPTTLPAATVGVAYPAQTIIASGGTAPYSYAITGGALPAGMTLASNGTLSGTPTAGGSFNITVTATDSSSGTHYTGSRLYAFTVNPPTLSLSPGAGSLSGSFGTAFSQTFSASGGTPNYTYALNVTSGTLPAGLSFSAATGVLSGTPSAAGTVGFTITATDSSSGSGPYAVSNGYTLTVAAPTITLSPATLPMATVGASYSQAVSASGGVAPYHFSLAGSLPAGLSFNTATGGLSGTPTAGGSFPITIHATDSNGFDSPTRSYSLVVNPPTLSLSPGAGSLSGSFGTAFSQTFSASGGTPNYTYALNVTSGTLPAGLSFSSATGVLSGTPSAAGTVGFTITATDSSSGSGPYAVSNGYTLTVAAPTITLSPATLPTATVGASYSQAVSASGGVAPYHFSLAGSLPAGLSFNTATGGLSGTPTAGGSFPITIHATDSNGFDSPTRSYSLVVNPPTLSLSPGAGSLSGSFGTAFSQTFSASGGTPNYTYALNVTSGTLPAGLSFSAATGVLSGTPSAAGTVGFTITATDSSSGSGPYAVSNGYTLTVAAPTITLSPATLPMATVGASYNQAVSASGGAAPYHFSLAGSLPAGLSFNTATGGLSGTPTAGGSFPITIHATDSNGFDSPTRSYSLVVNLPLLALNPAGGASFNGTAGTALNQGFVASGGTPGYTYALTVTSGSLPTGVTFSSATGVLSGTPTTSGTVGFLVTATDSSTGSGAPYSVQGSYTLNVAAPTLSLSPTSLTTPVLGAAYSQALAASGGVAPYGYSLIAGALPAGLSLDTGTGTIAGTPTAAGSFTLTVQASDANHFVVSHAYSFTVAPATVVVSTATLANGQTGIGYSQTITATGGIAPYSYAVTGGALPAGLSLNGSSGVLSGTPSADGSYSFTLTATDSATGSGAPFKGQHSYTVVIAPRTPIAGNDNVATAFATPVTIDLGAVITGGAATSVAVASGPSHGTATASGTSVTYTPAAGYAGSDSFTYTASNSGGTSAPGTVTINVQQQPPIAGAVTAAVTANSSGNTIALHLSGGPATAIAVATQPSHGSVMVSGTTLSYTPAANYFGQDSLTYTASGPGGTSAPAAVTITVAPLAVPAAVPQSASVLAGKSVTIHASAGASGGPFTAAAIVSAPSSGGVQVSGTDIVFTAALDSPATVDFTYSLSNAFGVSAPARVTVTVNPVPVAVSRHVSAIAGVAVQVDLSTGASGGPFTAAALLTVTPASAGQASINRNGAGDFILDFVPAATSSGTATIGFTLSNAYATSAPGTITVAITARSDPSRDPEVLGLLNAQADATRRFATAQIANFQQRLESLHHGEGVDAFSNQLSFSSASDRQRATTQGQGQTGDLNDPMRRYLIDPNEPAPGRSASADANRAPASWSVWTGGAVNFGSTDPNQSSRSQDFTTSGVSFGADHAFSPALAMGAGIGYSHDSTDIGHNGTHNGGDGYSAALYASYHPATSIYVDALLGYQRLSFDSRRYVTDNGNLVSGSRDGHQWFGSFSAGYDYRRGELSVSPYLRLDLARASLDPYSERGDAIYALDYRRQSVDTSTSSLGVHLDYRQETRWGVFAPRLRLEYEHDFQGAGQAAISYTDLVGGPLYSAKLTQYGQDRGLIGLGAALQTRGAWIIRVEYQYQFSSGSLDGQSILLNLNKSF